MDGKAARLNLMAKQMFRRVSRPQLILMRLKAQEPAAVFAQLMWIVNAKGYSPGYAKHKHKEIFGDWPAFEYVEPVIPSSDLRCWIENERRKYGARMGRK